MNLIKKNPKLLFLIFCVFYMSLIGKDPVRRSAVKDELLQVEEFFKTRDLGRIERRIKSMLAEKKGLSLADVSVVKRYLDNVEAIKREYIWDEKKLFSQIRTVVPDATWEDIQRWESLGHLEYYLINGVKRYFYLSVEDLIRLNKEAARRVGFEDKAFDAARYPIETIKAFRDGRKVQKTISVAFTFFEEVGNLPDKTLIRGWVPFPRANHFQSNIRLRESNLTRVILPSKKQSTALLYFERRIDHGNRSNEKWRRFFLAPEPNWIKKMSDPAPLSDSHLIAHFLIEYLSTAFFLDVNPESLPRAEIVPEGVAPFIKETNDHLFTPFLRKLSGQIVGEEQSPYLKARKIYHWICEHIVWTYSKPVLGDYADYTARYRRGDCGAKATLFISLCRLNGIPSKPQGGWRIEPGRRHSDHTWAQCYIDGLGWLPVDADAGSHLIVHEDPRVRYFYFGNRTPYRMIVYDGEPKLIPHKRYKCLNGGGAQIGAFEWKGGDLEPNIKIDSNVED